MHCCSRYEWIELLMDQVSFTIRSIDRCVSYLVMETPGYLRGSGSGMEGGRGEGERDMCKGARGRVNLEKREWKGKGWEEGERKDEGDGREAEVHSIDDIMQLYCIANIHMVACPPLHPLQHSAVLCVQHYTVWDVMYLSSLLWLQEIAVWGTVPQGWQWSAAETRQ